jgi:hypothetical protein
LLQLNEKRSKYAIFTYRTKDRKEDRKAPVLANLDEAADEV